MNTGVEIALIWALAIVAFVLVWWALASWGKRKRAEHTSQEMGITVADARDLHERESIEADWAEMQEQRKRELVEDIGTELLKRNPCPDSPEHLDVEL